MDFFENIVWGWCGWDTLAIIVFIAAAGIFVVRRCMLNKKIKELKEQLGTK